MKILRSFVALSCLFLCACASTYVVPEAVENARASLDGPKADEILKRAVIKSSAAQGLCASNVRPDRSAPQVVDLANGVMVFEEYDRKEQEIFAGQPMPALDRHRSRFEFDFTSVSQMRIT